MVRFLTLPETFGRGTQGISGSPFLTFFELFQSSSLNSTSMSLGYEPTRVLSRLSCSIIYVLLVSWCFLLFGRFCGRNVVGISISLHPDAGCVGFHKATFRGHLSLLTVTPGITFSYICSDSSKCTEKSL